MSYFDAKYFDSFNKLYRRALNIPENLEAGELQNLNRHDTKSADQLAPPKKKIAPKKQPLRETKNIETQNEPSNILLKTFSETSNTRTTRQMKRKRDN